MGSPAYEQGALPTLSLLPGEVSVRVLPGDKMYQAMAIEPHYMRELQSSLLVHTAFNCIQCDRVSDDRQLDSIDAGLQA